MSASVIISGRAREAGGLKESLTKFTKHHAEVGDALLNISGIGTNGVELDENDPRPAYNFTDAANQWPLMVYHAQHGELTVHNEAELKEAKKQGYRDDPYPKPQIEVLSPELEKKKIKDENDQLRGQLAKLEDKLNRLAEAQEPKKG